jgi:hypothetical protein
MLISKYEPFKKETARQVRLIEIFRVLILMTFFVFAVSKSICKSPRVQYKCKTRKKQDTYRLKNV